ncbi:hypothetical protein RclHR1_01400001 [Rhizophagus clarus]|uniref:Uncharacterized protein n=1 Tax=Rhizophagus clarus TaxID=94130 RepID=A0A2Z6R447_9GLOM|nr:hypothetical protein RclHR1_01400001 [Rhizophagus clarus]GES98155.1 hypothetical protein GLOIN_2v1469300 [Rhizophagus clarus]
MDNNKHNSSQNNLGDNKIYSYPDYLPQTSDIQTEHFLTNINCNVNDGSWNHDVVNNPAHTDISLNPNYQQQYYFSNNNSTVSPSQSAVLNDIPNNIDTFSNQQQQNGLNNISQHNYQQPMPTFNVVSPPQFYPHYIEQDPQLTTNVFSLLNSLGIHINSPQTNIIFMPTTDSDIQSRLQQVHTYLNNNFSSTNNSQT